MKYSFIIIVVLVIPVPIQGIVNHTELRVNQIDTVKTESGAFTDYEFSPSVAPYYTIDGGNAIWFTMWNQTKLYRFDKVNETLTTIELPQGVTPLNLRFDTMGKLWFTDNDFYFKNLEVDYVGYYDFILNNVSIYEIPTTSPNLFEIYEFNDYMYFSEFGTNKIARILTTGEGDVEEFQLDCPEENSICGPIGMNEDNSGNFWYVDTYRSEFVQHNFETNTSSRYPSPAETNSPVALKKDSNGIFWSGSHGKDTFYSFDPNTKIGVTYLTKTPPPENNYPISGLNDVNIDKDGNIWAAEHFYNKFVMLDIDTLTVNEYSYVEKQPLVQFLTVTDDFIWFPKEGTNSLGKVNKAELPIMSVQVEKNISIKQKFSKSIKFTVESIRGEDRQMTPFIEFQKMNNEFVHEDGVPKLIKSGASVEFKVKLQYDSTEFANQYVAAVGVKDGDDYFALKTVLIQVEETFYAFVYDLFWPFVLAALFWKAITRTSKNNKENPKIEK